MDEQRKQHLIKTLNDNGMTVLLTRDYNAIGLELARLRRFERHIRLAGDVDTQLSIIIKNIDRDTAALLGQAQPA